MGQTISGLYIWAITYWRCISGLKSSFSFVQGCERISLQMVWIFIELQFRQKTQCVIHTFILVLDHLRCHPRVLDMRDSRSTWLFAPSNLHVVPRHR